MAQIAYVRFNNVTISNTATITEAYIEFVPYEDSPSGTCNLTIYCEAADNPSAPNNVSDLEARSLTNGVSWNSVDAWYDGVATRTPDIVVPIQEVISRSGWASGQAINIIIKDNNSDVGATRSFSSFEFLSGDEKPRLHLEYGDYPPGIDFYTSGECVGLSVDGVAVSAFDYATPVDLGIETPTTGTSAAEGAAGNPNGTYYYKITNLNYGGFESNPSTAIGPITVSSKKIELTDIPISDDLQVIQRRIYRTENGGTDYRLVATIDDNRTTSYTDNTADADLGALVETDHYTPEEFSHVEAHNSLLWGVEAARKHVVWYCKQFDAWEYFPLTYYEAFGADPNGTKALVSLGEYLVVVQRDRIYNFNTKEDPEEKYLSFSDRGAVGSKAVVSIGDAIIIGDAGGLYLFDTVRDIIISTPVEDLFDPYGSHEYRISATYASNMIISHLDDYIFCSYTTHDSTTNNVTVVFNRKSKSFEGIMTTGFKAFAVDRELKKLYGCADNGKIYVLRTNTQDHQTDISWSFTTKDISREFGTPNILKTGDFIKIDCDPGGNDLTVELFYDDTSVKTWTLSGSSRYVERKRMPINTQFYRIALKFSGTGVQKVYGVTVQVKTHDI